MREVKEMRWRCSLIDSDPSKKRERERERRHEKNKKKKQNHPKQRRSNPL